MSDRSITAGDRPGNADKPGQNEASRGRAGRRAIAAWCFYDFANSAFTTVITTFIFAAYFTQAVASDPIEGTVSWSRAVTVAGLVIALFSPVLGAIADLRGARKPWLLAFTILCVIPTGLLWTVRPDPDFATYALVLYALATTAYHFGLVFYDAMLPRLAPAAMLGRVSGWGWALGYVGGLLCLLACLWLVGPGGRWLGLDAGQAEPVRATAILVAAWFAVFSVPVFLLTPDRPPTGLGFGDAVAAGLRRVAGIPRLLRKHPTTARFLLAHMLYTDGLVTLFAFGGIYAAAEFGMAPTDILVFGIVLNVCAGLGAAGFAWIDDWFGSRRTIRFALVGLIVSGTGLVLVREAWHFWLMACILGLFVGPAQAAGRSLMARLAPADVETEMFGLYAFAGKATAFAGPFVLGLVVQASGSQRAGMATVLVFLAAGWFILGPLREPAPTDQRAT
jgi:UMF1 family MFS transporter